VKPETCIRPVVAWFLSRGSVVLGLLRVASVVSLLLYALLVHPQRLFAQTGGSGLRITSPENVNGVAPSCDGYRVGYSTAPAPVPGTCTDFIKTCVSNGSTASWQTKNVAPSYARPCKPSTGVNACQAYKCGVGQTTCDAFDAPITCPPSADGCTVYECDPEVPGTCKIGQVKDPKACTVEWEDQAIPCGGKPISRSVKTISDACCTYKVGYTEQTTRVSPPCVSDQNPACSVTVARLGNTGQCSVTVQSTGGPVDNLNLSKQATVTQSASSSTVTFTAEPRSMTSVRVENITQGSSVNAALTIVAQGGDSISNQHEPRAYGVCNWNGTSCYKWDFPHGGSLSCTNHAQCTGAFAVSGGQTQQADYGSLLDMKKGSFGFQASKQGVQGAGASIAVVIRSTSPAPAQIKITVLSFDDYKDKLTQQERIVEVAGTRSSIVDAPRNWNAPSSESFTQPCRVGESTSFDAVVRFKGKSAVCSQSVSALPPDSCGRNSRTPSLEPDPNYGNPDCCNRDAKDPNFMKRDCCAGATLSGTFRAYDGIDFKAQETLGSYKYNDGNVQWKCQRNSSAVTVANPTAIYNLAFLGWTNQASTYLQRLMTDAFKSDGAQFKKDLDSRVYGGAAGVALKAEIDSGAVANSCFVCGQTRTEGGCFPPGVRIATGDGSTSKRVEEISAGDILWNPVLKSGFKVLTISEGREKKDLVVVRAGAQTLKMTTEHPVLTKGGMKQAIELVRGDIVLDGSGREVAVEAITREPAQPGLSVLNFILERSGNAHDGLLLADGLVVGDLTIQRGLAAHGKK